jgi:hypothetical protein
LILLGRHSVAWATPPALFALVIFQRGSHVFAQGHLRLQSSYLCVLCSRDDKHTYHHTQFIG